MAHGEASGGPVLPPQRRSLQQRFGPHARARDGRGTVRRLLALYARWGRELLLVVCLTLLSTGAALAVPYLLGRAVDCFLPWGGVERAALSVLLPTLAGAAAAQWLGNWGRRRWMEILSQRMVARIRRECFAKLGRLPLSYFDRHPHGDTMNRLVSDADNVSTVAAETVTQLLSSLLMVAGALAIMAALSPLLTLTALATVPVIALCTRLISRRSRTLYRRQADELGRLSGLVQESLSNSRTVKLYHQQEELLARFDQMNGALCATSVKAQICAGLLSPLVNMVNNLGFALIACAGGVLALRGAVSVGLVVSFLGYSRQLGRPLNSIAALFSSIQQAVAGAERLFEILDEPELPPDVPGAVSPRTVRGEVSFADVSFSYEPDRPVLEHVSFRVRAGEVAAFVGETGAGKTTLVNLLIRAYEPTAGEIRLDGVPLRGAPGDRLFPRHGAGQSALCPPGGHGGGGCPCGKTGPCPRFHPAPAPGVPNPHVGGGRGIQPGAVPAFGHGPGPGEPGAYPHPGRGHQQCGYYHGAAAPAGHPPPAGGPHLLPDRPPSLHHPPGRPHLCGGGAGDRGVRHI